MNIDACPVAELGRQFDAVADAERGFNRYCDNVLRPIFCADQAVDDGELAVWLNWQIDEWEAEAERPEGLARAPLAVEALGHILDAIERLPADLDAWRAGLEALAAERLAA
jgi:hypothetical protein